MHCTHGIQGVQTLALFRFLNFASECRLLPLWLRPEQLPLTACTCCVVARCESGGSGGEGGALGVTG